MPGDLATRAKKIAERLKAGARNRKPVEFDEFVAEHLYNEEGLEYDDPEFKQLKSLIVTELGGRQAAAVPQEQNEEAAELQRTVEASPYRFVEIADQVVLAPEAVRTPCNDTPLQAGFSGVIEVEWAAETPLLIGVEEGQGANPPVGPLRLGKNYVIPGATLRGMMRAAMETVCRARLTQVNKHHTYGVRDFNHPLFAEDGDGAKRLAWSNLKAGWLCKAGPDAPPKGKDDSDYVITPCRKHMVRIRALPAEFNGGSETGNGAWHRTWLTTRLRERYKLASIALDNGKIFDFSITANFTLDAEGYVLPETNGSLEGTYVFSGHSPTANKTAEELDEQERNPGKGDLKKREYVFSEDPAGRPLRLKRSAFDRFELINSKPSKNKRIPDGSYAVLSPTLKDGKRIPVFYTGELDGDQNGLHIGLTRLFKLGHSKSVGDKLALQPAHRPDTQNPDMIEALFGYVFEESDVGLDRSELTAPGQLARKGRVAFGFATLIDQASARQGERLRVVTMGPRASFASFYLRGQQKDWSNPDARLAGRKRYFPRFPAQSGALATAAKKIEEDLQATAEGIAGNETVSTLRFLKPRVDGGELVFRGEIRLHNVLKEEVGALLWTLTHGGNPAKPYRHMLGRAKTFGAGQVRVKAVRLNLRPHDAEAAAVLRTPLAAWENAGREGWCKPGSQSLAPFLRAFHEYMYPHCPGWPLTLDLREFFGSCTPCEGERRYPRLREFKLLRGRANKEAEHFKRSKTPSPGALNRYLAHQAVDPATVVLPYLPRN